jgi:hypothetical protein
LTITSASLPNGVAGMTYNAGLVATGGTPPYNWSVALQPSWMTWTASGALSGTPATTGTSTVSVTVVDSSTPTPQSASQQLSLTINPAAAACTSSGSEAVLKGQYAFSLSGFMNSGFLSVVGSFTADGAGNITAGEADTNGVLGAQTGKLLITPASSYSVGSDNRGCATLATPFGTFITRFALGSISSNIATEGRIIEWDSPSSSDYIASGRVLQQTAMQPSSPYSQLSGSYVFRALGWDSATSGRDACVGIMVASVEVLGSLEEYCNDAGTVIGPLTIASPGTYTTFDGNGRATVTATMATTTSTGSTTNHLTLYNVSGLELLLVNSDPTPTISGEMQQQTVPAGGFTQISLDGNMVFYLTGASSPSSGAVVSVATATADGISNLTLTSYEDRLGAWQGTPPLNVACTYTVTTNGQVSLTGSSCGINPPVLFLTAPNTGLLVDAALGVDVGAFEPQAAGPFSNSSLSGAFFAGLAEVVSQSIGTLSVSEMTMAPGSGAAGSAGGTETFTSTTSQTEDSPITDTYTVNADGTFTTGSSSGAVVGIVINSNQFVMIDDVTSTYPILLIVEK